MDFDDSFPAFPKQLSMPNLSKQQDILAPDSFSLPPASFHPLELERVLRSFDSLIDKMSHDLNGPLATISGLVQLAQMSDDVEEVRMHLSRIHQVSSKLSGLLGELVELSSLHGSESNPRMIDVAESIEDAVAALSECPEAKTTQLIVEATPCRVLLDGARLRSIVQHLVSNALLHHDSTKSEKWVKVIVEKEDDFLSIQVNDNGKGMDI